MSRFISQKSIDEVVSRSDIVSLIGEYVPLVQKGNDWWGCCPFHHEKTPSFSVSADKKFYYCFGCHEKGTVVNFIMEMEKLSYPEAIEVLAKKNNITLEYNEGFGSSKAKEDPEKKIKEEYINLYTRVANMFHYMLMETEAGSFALDYITKRGLSKETLEKFKIGYSPANRLWLRKFLTEKNYTKEFLDKSGLFSHKYPDYSMFSDRLMFPIFDKTGQTVALGGRFLRGDSEKSPKYVNSGDLVQYKKGQTLYAFNFAKESIRKNKKIILCEGYMDCIAYHQCKITYAVAPLGTALTEDQIELFKRFEPEVYLSFDSDSAGINATKRAMIMCRRQGLSVKVIVLSGGKDPAEIMVNLGPDSLTNEVNNAILDNDFLLSKLLEVYPKDTIDGKAKASLEYFEYVDSLQSDIQKSASLESLCQAFGLDPLSVRHDYLHRENVSRKIVESKSVSQNKPEIKQKISLTAELRAVLCAFSEDESYFNRMRSEISADDLDDYWAKELFILMEECSRNGTFSVPGILARCEKEELSNLLLQYNAQQIPLENEGDPSHQLSRKEKEKSLEDSIRTIKLKVLNRKRKELLNTIRRIERSVLPDDKNQLKVLLQTKMELDRRIAQLKG